MPYKMTWDMHTHTTYSHGIGSIDDNVAVAREKGLQLIGITDHGPDHITYGVKKEKLPEMREIVDSLNHQYDDIKVLLGVEANIMNADGDLGLSEDDKKYLDYVIAGYHYGALGHNAFKAGVHHGLNYLYKKTGKYTKALKKRNTRNAVNAILNNEIRIITHPGDKGPEDLLAIALACEKTGTYMELNSSHMSLSIKDIKLLKETKAMFCISSDAHNPNRVGEFEPALEVALEAGLSIDRIANIIEV
ncbi:MAG: PHP domain-containing protein [Clostridiales Family XIII bacterium]|jgi:putative hydrolase|nr:PHP domain-containing protein [Clostridiales Family XIII bacterium]